MHATRVVHDVFGTEVATVHCLIPILVATCRSGCIVYCVITIVGGRLGIGIIACRQQTVDATNEITQFVITLLLVVVRYVEAALGNVKNPENSSAIVAVQTANAAPLALTKIAYYQFVEDYERVLIDMMHAYYGVRQVKITDEVLAGEDGQTEKQTRVEMYDFGTLPVEALDLIIHIGEASYWSRILQISTLNNLQTAGVMPSNADFLARMPEGSVKDQEELVEAAKRLQQQQSMQQLMTNGGM